MAITIRKRVNFDFLGDEYKEAYLVFRSIPLADYEKIIDEMPENNPRYVQLIQAKETGELSAEDEELLTKLQAKEAENNKRNFRMVLDYLKKYFISGEFPDEQGSMQKVNNKEELEGLDKDSAIRCFNVLTGQEIDPKDES